MENKEAPKMKKKARVYSAWVNGTATQLKAYNVLHALKGFRQYDPNLEVKDVQFTNISNPQQSVWDEK